MRARKGRESVKGESKKGRRCGQRGMNFFLERQVERVDSNSRFLTMTWLFLLWCDFACVFLRMNLACD